MRGWPHSKSSKKSFGTPNAGCNEACHPKPTARSYADRSNWTLRRRTSTIGPKGGLHGAAVDVAQRSWSNKVAKVKYSATNPKVSIYRNKHAIVLKQPKKKRRNILNHARRKRRRRDTNTKVTKTFCLSLPSMPSKRHLKPPAVALQDVFCTGPFATPCRRGLNKTQRSLLSQGDCERWDSNQTRRPWSSRLASKMKRHMDFRLTERTLTKLQGLDVGIVLESGALEKNTELGKTQTSQRTFLVP